MYSHIPNHLPMDPFRSSSSSFKSITSSPNKAIPPPPPPPPQKQQQPQQQQMLNGHLPSHAFDLYGRDSSGIGQSLYSPPPPLPPTKKITSLPPTSPLYSPAKQSSTSFEKQSQQTTTVNSNGISTPSQTRTASASKGLTKPFEFHYTVPKLIEPNPVDCVLAADSDLGALYIGNLDAALSIEILKKHKIRAVLTTSVETGFRYAEESIHFHENLPAHDKEGYDITQHFEKGIEFIERNRTYTSVLVHCFAGISRSASICIAYMMKKNFWSLEKALWHIKKCRPFVNPNTGFMRKLTQYEQHLQLIGHYGEELQQQQELLQSQQLLQQQQQLQMQMQEQLVMYNNPDERVQLIDASQLGRLEQQQFGNINLQGQQQQLYIQPQQQQQQQIYQQQQLQQQPQVVWEQTQGQFQQPYANMPRNYQQQQQQQVAYVQQDPQTMQLGYMPTQQEQGFYEQQQVYPNQLAEQMYGMNVQQQLQNEDMHQGMMVMAMPPQLQPQLPLGPVAPQVGFNQNNSGSGTGITLLGNRETTQKKLSGIPEYYLKQQAQQQMLQQQQQMQNNSYAMNSQNALNQRRGQGLQQQQQFY